MKRMVNDHRSLPCSCGDLAGLGVVMDGLVLVPVDGGR